MNKLPRSESVRPAGILAQTRAALASWLWKASDENPRRGRLLLEQLEQRQLMAGDTDLLFTDGVSATFSASTNSAGVYAAATSAEGEAAPDLVAFAKALADAGVKFYGAAWCPFCTEQKQLFEDGYKYLPFIEVTKADHSLNSVGQAAGIQTFPTWEFPDGSRLENVQTLATLSQRSGVAIPTSNKPSFAVVPAQTVAIGSPMHVPIDAYNPGGGPITVTVSVADPSLLDASVLSGNRSIRIDMNGYNDMVFQLFESEAPRPAGRVIDLANQGFYDGLIFHRVVDNFVIQGGDPTGTGTSGSSLGNFDDQFNANLQHNRSGVLSFAKTTDDTNNSQFFITETPQRSLDFNHSIFGQLIEGEDVREAISEVDDANDKDTDGNNKPKIDIKMTSVDVFTDTENSLIRLKAKGTQTGSTTVTITATNSDGQTFTQVVPVSVVADSGTGSNSQPFLADIPAPPTVTNGGPATLQLSSTDIEGDAVTYTATSQTTGVTATVNATTGLVTVTPSSGFTGAATVLVGVQPATGVVGALSGQSDTQKVTFNFQSTAAVAAPSSVVLATASDSGASNSDRITNAGTLTFTVSGVTAGNEVRLFNGTTEIGRGTATSTTINITTGNIAALGDGTYNITARQFSGTTSSDASPGISVVYDGTAPVQVTGLPTNANIGTALNINLTHPEEGSGLRYAFTTAPTGATIDATTGVVTWTPTSTQTGTQNFTLTLTDTAGNVRTQPFAVTVAGTAQAGVRLELTNLAGNVVTSVSNGEEFFLKFYAQDLRGTFDRKGVFSAFADVTFNSALVQPVTSTPIQYGSAFSTSPDGTFAQGLIDELGAISNNLAATNLGEVLVATVRMKAIGTGTVSFISDPAETTGNEFLLFENDNAIDPSLIQYGRADLAIGTRFTAANDTVTVAQGANTTTVDVLANDTFTSGNTGTLTINSVGTPSGGGTVTIVNNKLSYKPLATFSGIETFTYVVKDETGSTQTATVTATVTATNSVPPTAVADSFTVLEDAAEASFNVRSNDSTTVAGATISVTAVGTPSKGGTVRLGSDGASIFYKPAANANGTETVTYTLTDSKGATATGTVTFTITAVNDAPPANALTKTIFKSTSAVTVATLADYGTNVDGTETLTISLVGSSSAGGTFAVSGTSITYVPPTSTFTGTDTISYKVTDAGGLSTTGTITLQVADGSPTQFLLAADSGALISNLQSLTLTATGTTSGGQTVTKTGTYDSTSKAFKFADLVPGSYSVQVPAVPFLIGMEQAQTVSFDAASTGGTVNKTFTGGLLNPAFINLRDYFNNAPRQSIFAVVTPGSDSIAVLGAGSTTAVTNPVVKLNSAGNSVTISGKDSTGAAKEATLPATNDRRVETRGTSGNMRLLKISLATSDVTFSTPTTTASTTTPTSAAAKSSDDSSAQATATNSTLLSDPSLSAEGEASNDSTSNQSVASIVSNQDDTAAVDAAMNDVTDASLKRVSLTGDQIAESDSSNDSGYSAAVDQLLSSL